MASKTVIRPINFCLNEVTGQLFLFAWAYLISVLQSFMAQSKLNNTVEQCRFVYTSCNDRNNNQTFLILNSFNTRKDRKKNGENGENGSTEKLTSKIHGCT